MKPLKIAGQATFFQKWRARRRWVSIKDRADRLWILFCSSTQMIGLFLNIVNLQVCNDAWKQDKHKSAEDIRMLKQKM